MAEKISNMLYSILPKSSEEKESKESKKSEECKESKDEEITLEYKEEMTLEECQELLAEYKKICKEDDVSSPTNCTETIENLEKMCSE